MGEPRGGAGGPIEPGWGREALLAQRAPGQVPGTTLRFMRTERFRGRPYVLHVPDDYRGDEPFPLVVVLGGGPGRAIPTAQTARSTLEPRGELAVFPQANGMWWEPEPGAAVAALLAEVLADLDVDTDRVTITGFSNGGTGSLLYASRMPHRFAAVASLMGGGLPFFEKDGPIDAAAIARLPFLFVHGDRDEQGTTIALRLKNVKRLRLLLRRELLDLSAPVRVTIDGREAFAGPVAEAPALLLRSWRETGDPQLAHSAEIVLDVP